MLWGCPAREDDCSEQGAKTRERVDWEPKGEQDSGSQGESEPGGLVSDW